MIFHLYAAGCRENAKNTKYPHTVTIENLDDLKEAVKTDHIAAKMRDARRSVGNFVSADCLMMDIDNTHSEEPEDWVSPDDVADALPGVLFYYIFSRNHMKPKSKTARDGTVTHYAPRGKYHFYFPMGEKIESPEKYDAAAAELCKAFPYFDQAADDAAHFFFGVEAPEGGVVEGEITLDKFLEELPEVVTPRAESVAQDDLTWIDCGEQRKAAGWFKTWADQYGVEWWNQYRINAISKTHANAVVFCVRCPWEDEHSIEGAENEAVIIIDVSGKINFLCRHSHGDRYGWKEYRKKIEAAAAPPEVEAQAAASQGEPSNRLKWGTMKDVEARKVEWLIPLRIPRRAVTLIGGDGGTGKTSIECSLAAAISAGRTTFLEKLSMDAERPAVRVPGRVVLLNSEDPYQQVIKPLLDANQAVMENIFVMDETQISESGVSYSDERLKTDIEALKPDLIIFDPLQAFLADKVKMAERNQIRREVGHALALAKRCNAAVVLVMHTNKQRQAWGRARLADSADLWDMARSVFIVGTDEKDVSVRYMSHEKSNFSTLQDTVNFTIMEDRTVRPMFLDQRRDEAHMLAKMKAARPDKETKQSAMDEAKDAITAILEDAEGRTMKAIDLQNELKTCYGIGQNTIDKAKAEMKKDGLIRYRPEGGGRGKTNRIWFVELTRQANNSNDALLQTEKA